MAIIRLPKASKWILIPLLISAGIWFFLFKEKNNTSIVTRVEVKNRVVEKTTTSSGVIQSKSEANLSFQASGKISWIGVSKGDQVVKGQLLATLDRSSQIQDLEYYKNQVEIKERQLELFVAGKDNTSKTKGGETAYNLTLRQYQESVKQAEAQYNSQLASMNNQSIRSPIKGTVTDVPKNAGETATAGQTVVTVADLNSLTFKIFVDQEDFGILKEGMLVDVKLDSYPNTVFKGKILSLPFFANEATSKFEVEVETLPIEGKSLVLGMTGDAYIILQSSSTEVPSLSVDEVSYDEADNPYVWILDNGKIKKMPITITLDGDIYVQLQEGISQTVLVSAKDGQKMIEGYTAKVIN